MVSRQRGEMEDSWKEGSRRKRKSKLFNEQSCPSWEAENNSFPMCESSSKICSLNGLVKREDGMELGPCHIGKIEEIHIHRLYR